MRENVRRLIVSSDIITNVMDIMRYTEAEGPIPVECLFVLDGQLNGILVSMLKDN